MTLTYPTTAPVVKFWKITQAVPPVSSTTIVPSVQLVGQGGNTNHYIARATVVNFDSDQIRFVAMALTNPQPSPSGMIWHYYADVLPAPYIGVTKG